MRDQAYRTTSRTDAPPLLPADVPYLYVRTRDDITDRLEEIFNRPLATQQDRDRARVQLYALSIQAAKLAAEERKEREAARAAERAAQRAAREAFTKEAIARQVEAAVREALAKAVGKAVEASPPAEPEKPEEPIIIDASRPWDLSQFGGKKPRISCVVPVITSMRTGKLFDVNEPSPLDPPEHMLRDEFRRKPQSPSASASAEVAQGDVPSATVTADPDCQEGVRECEPGEKPSAVGATEVVGHGFSLPRPAVGHDGPRPSQTEDRSHDRLSRKGGGTEARQRWESRTEDQLHSAEGPGGAERSATDKKAEPEPKDAKPKKDANNPYSITTLLPDPPRPFESKPRDPCTDPPETPPPAKPPAKPGPRLHPIIEYWGLH